MKLSGLVRRGTSGMYTTRLNERWRSWGFQANFMGRFHSPLSCQSPYPILYMYQGTNNKSTNNNILQFSKKKSGLQEIRRPILYFCQHKSPTRGVCNNQLHQNQYLGPLRELSLNNWSATSVYYDLCSLQFSTKKYNPMRYTPLHPCPPALIISTAVADTTSHKLTQNIAIATSHHKYCIIDSLFDCL